MSTKTNYIGYKLVMNIKKGNLSGYFLPSKISDFPYSIESLVCIGIIYCLKTSMYSFYVLCTVSIKGTVIKNLESLYLKTYCVFKKNIA